MSETNFKIDYPEEDEEDNQNTNQNHSQVLPLTQIKDKQLYEERPTHFLASSEQSQQKDLCPIIPQLLFHPSHQEQILQNNPSKLGTLDSLPREDTSDSHANGGGCTDNEILYFPHFNQVHRLTNKIDQCKGEVNDLQTEEVMSCSSDNRSMRRCRQEKRLSYIERKKTFSDSESFKFHSQFNIKKVNCNQETSPQNHGYSNNSIHVPKYQQNEDQGSITLVKVDSSTESTKGQNNLSENKEINKENLITWTRKVKTNHIIEEDGDQEERLESCPNISIECDEAIKEGSPSCHRCFELTQIRNLNAKPFRLCKPEMFVSPQQNQSQLKNQHHNSWQFGSSSSLSSHMNSQTQLMNVRDGANTGTIMGTISRPNKMNSCEPVGIKSLTNKNQKGDYSDQCQLEEGGIEDIFQQKRKEENRSNKRRGDLQKMLPQISLAFDPSKVSFDPSHNMLFETDKTHKGRIYSNSHASTLVRPEKEESTNNCEFKNKSSRESNWVFRNSNEFPGQMTDVSLNQTLEARKQVQMRKKGVNDLNRKKSYTVGDKNSESTNNLKKMWAFTEAVNMNFHPIIIIHILRNILKWEQLNLSLVSKELLLAQIVENVLLFSPQEQQQIITSNQQLNTQNNPSPRDPKLSILLALSIDLSTRRKCQSSTEKIKKPSSLKKIIVDMIGRVRNASKSFARGSASFQSESQIVREKQASLKQRNGMNDNNKNIANGNNVVDMTKINNSINCNVCLDEIKGGKQQKFLTPQCIFAHPICEMCVSKYLAQKINANDVEMIPCPECTCSGIFKKEEIKSRIDPLLFAKYQRFLRLATIKHDPLIQPCSRAGCEGYGRVKPGSKVSLVVCNRCGLNMCLRCGQKNHPGTECTLYAEISPSAAMEDIFLSRCPECREAFKNNASNHLHLLNESELFFEIIAKVSTSCVRCKYKFCWTCFESHLDNSLPHVCIGARNDTIEEEIEVPMYRKILNYILIAFLIMLVPVLLIIIWPLFSLHVPHIIAIEKYGENYLFAQPFWKSFYRFLVLYLLGIALFPIWVIPTSFIIGFRCVYYHIYDKSDDKDDYRQSSNYT